jgi:hypothetical protein
MIPSPLIKPTDISDNINSDADFSGEQIMTRWIGYKHTLRFGEIAVMKGIITADQLEEALEEQTYQDLSDNTHKLVGEILCEKGWMTQTQIVIVLEDHIKNRYSKSYPSAI